MGHLEHIRFEGEGQNLYKDPSGANGVKATEAWYNEVEHYDFTDGESSWQTTGHFSQVVWKASTHVGIAVSSNGQYLAAQYFPAGNFRGRFQENVAPASGGSPPPPPPAGARALMSHHGTYLTAWDDGTVRVSHHVKEWEHWTKVDVGGGKVALQSYHGNYLSAWDDGTVRLANHVQEWEHWTILDAGEGKIALQSHHGNFLSAWDDDTVKLVNQVQEWERWTW